MQKFNNYGLDCSNNNYVWCNWDIK